METLKVFSYTAQVILLKNLYLPLCMVILLVSCGPRFPNPGPNSGTNPGLPAVPRDASVQGILDQVTKAALVPRAPGRGMFWKDVGEDELVAALLASMDDETLLAQVFMVGWASAEPDGPVMDWLRQRPVGGIKVFGWNAGNPEQLANTLGIMQRTVLSHGLSIPLITATDQEGGWVRHIRGETSITPGNLALGAGAIPQDAWMSGYYIGQELRAMGVNMNFAPTVDVYSNPEAHVIGPRAFSSDTTATAVLGTAFFEGQDSTRVMSTAKHFPGHGNAVGDSHGVLPVVQDSLERIKNFDLIPFQSLIDDAIPSVLIGHLNFPKVSRDGRPASLSSVIIKDLLRETMGYDGLVITDDIYMGGAANFGTEQGWGIDQVILEALKAGNDMVMISRTPSLNDQIWKTCLREYQNNPAFAEQIRDSVARILRLKIKYLKPEDRVPLIPDVQKVTSLLPAPGSEEFFRNQAYRAVTILKDALIPFAPKPGERVAIIGQDADFLRIGRQEYPGSTVYQFDYEPFYFSNAQARSEALALARNADYVLFCLANPNSLEVLKELKPLGPKVIVMSTLTPIYLQELPWIETSIAIYGWGIDSFRGGFDALTGVFEPQGRLPLKW